VKRAQFCAALAPLALAPMGVPSPAAAQADNVIHVGVSPFEAHGDAYYALDQGYFKQAGLNIDIQQYQGGSAIVTAIVGGALQIGAGNPLPLAQARQRGINVELIAPGYIYDANAPALIDAMVVAAKSPLRKASDFNGKTIAVTGVRGLDQIAAFAWFDQHGGDSNTVKVVEIPQPAMVDAVAAGRVDAAMVSDPFLTAGIADGKVQLFEKVYRSFGKPIFVSTWFASQDWADRNPDIVRKFAAAINDASAWAVKNPEAAAAVLQKYMKVTFTRAHEYHARTLDPAYIQPILDGASRYKIIDPMKASDLIWKG
jgi:NitT/TauT family transport system substrate-binding protein